MSENENENAFVRRCSLCHRLDARVMLRDEPCTCLAEDRDLAPDHDHTPDCARVGHQVLLWAFPRVYRPRDLVRDATVTHGYRLPGGLAGWKLVERQLAGEVVPGQFVRVRLLCRACITATLDARDRHREYEQARERAQGKGRGRGRAGWANSIAGQDSL